MPQIVEFNGNRIEFPDGMAPAEMEAVLKQNAMSIRPKGAEKPAPSFGKMFKDEMLTSLPGGLVRGVKDVIDTGAGFLSRLGGSDEAAKINAQNEAGKAEFKQAQQNVGAGGSNITRVGGQILATAPVGGVLGVTAKAAGATRLGNALASGGMTTGAPAATTFAGRAADMVIRMAGGGATGYAMAGLANPDDATSGGVIGAMLPPAAKLAGFAGQRVAQAFRSARTPQEVKLAQQLAVKLGITADDLAAAQMGPEMIPGYQRTVPQIMQDPTASQLQRTLKTAGGDALGAAERTQQAQFRSALERVAPIAPSTQDAANRAGNAIQDFAIPAERQAGQRVTELFDAIPPNEATMQLPLQQMQNAQTRFLGPGTFGKGGQSAEQAIGTATNIGMDQATLTPRNVPFDQIQSLRSSIGEAINDAQANGRNQAAAALTQMKNAIDNKVADVAAGNALPGEVFTPQAIDTWGQALAAHSAKKAQFNTGPQVGMFRQGGDGQRAMQGAEIPGKFFNGNRSQVEDIQALHRLIGDRADLAQEMKRFAVTEGYGTSDAAGNLTSKFTSWMESRSGANRGLFTEQERATLSEVGKAVERSLKAEQLGRVTNSDTAQKLADLQRNGLLDSRLVDVLANRIPGVGSFTGPLLTGMRNTATQGKQVTMSGLLADPARMEAALRDPRLGSGLLNLQPEAMGLLTQGVYRSAPLLGGSR